MTNDQLSEVRTRMAPSPTGFLHVGNLRTALYDFLLARKNNGKFILRIEDTDQARFVEGSLEHTLQVLNEVGLKPDEGVYWDNGVKEKGEFGPYQQSKKLEVYKKYAEELIQKGNAYYCFCLIERLEQLRKSQQEQKLPPKYDKHCLTLSKEEIEQKLNNNEPHVVRLNVPADQTIRFNDMVHGEISIQSNDVDDQVLMKSDGFPTYHLANVVDDHLMKISHVIRGEEWIPSTPKHVLLYSALGWESPRWIHLPLLLGKDRKKLSKREGDVAAKDFLEKGYLPEALINFVAFLGWNPKTEQEIFNLRELVEQFSIEKINKSGAAFDLEKLDWINGYYIRHLSIEELFARIVPYLIKAGIDIGKYPQEFLYKVLLLEQERLKKLSEIGDRVKYFFEEPSYDPQLLMCPPSRKATAGPQKLQAEEEKSAIKETIIKNLNALQELIQSLTAEQIEKSFLEARIKKLVEQEKLNNGEVLWPLRVALSGVKASPGPFEIMDALGVLPNGKEIILRRINKAVEKLF